MSNKKISALTAATTPLTGAEIIPVVQSSATVSTTIAGVQAAPVAAGTANSVVYLNGSKVPTTGAALKFDGANLGVGVTPNAWATSIGLKAIQFSTTGVLYNYQFGGTNHTAISDNAYLDSGGTPTYITSNFASLYDQTNGVHNWYSVASGTAGNNFSYTKTMSIAVNGIVTMPAYGAGAATFSAAGVISSVSDETWKVKDGAPVDADAMLNKLEPGYWYYNDEKKDTFGADRQLGFYAQNVNAAIGPEAAPEPEEGKPWGYYDRSVLAVTVLSLQKALATIESLKIRLAALENK